MPIAKTATTNISTLDCKNILTIPATNRSKAPTNKNLPIELRSLFITVDKKAMPKNMVAVPPNAVMIKLTPLFRPSIGVNNLDSMSPIKKVKANNIAIPALESLVFSMANIKANAPPRKTIALMPTPKLATIPVVMPIHAPKTVGSIERARSQYVFLSTVFEFPYEEVIGLV